MKYLGIDYGTKRVGLAISDEGGYLARPLETIKTPDSLKKIIEICSQEKIEAIVMGRSVDGLGYENNVQNLINEFADDIGMNIQIPIYFQDEAFSSHVAHGTQGKEMFSASKSKFNKTENLDAKAAAVILQRYLDKNNKNK